ncbi:MAG: hypothetical protein ACLVES_02820 [Faecalibacterium prausnitzii]
MEQLKQLLCPLQALHTKKMSRSAAHCTFQIGGPADVFIAAAGETMHSSAAAV